MSRGSEFFLSWNSNTEVAELRSNTKCHSATNRRTTATEKKEHIASEDAVVADVNIWESHGDPSPSKHNDLGQKLPTQVENKVKPHPFQTRQSKSCYLFHNHRKASERIYKRKFQEKGSVAFYIPLLSRRYFSCFVNAVS